MADVLDGCKSKADSTFRRSEIRRRDLHVRWDYRNVHLAAFANVLHHVLRLAGLRRQQSGHELHRIMRLQPRRVIGQQRVGRGVRLVEAVAGELLHVVKDLSGASLGEAFLRGAFGEGGALLSHLGGVLLAHRAAQQVSSTERVAADDIGDLHHLLLIDHHTEGLL